MKTQHTPGPWKVSEDYDDSRPMIYATQAQRIAIIDNRYEAEANARLIAAAPDMLKIIKEFCQRVEVGEVKSKKTYDKMMAIMEYRGLL